MIEIHATEIQTYHVCPRLHHYQYNEGLVPKETNDKLFIGTGVHAALEAYYGEGREPAQVFVEWFNTELPKLEEPLPEVIEDLEKQATVIEKVLKIYPSWAEEHDRVDVAEVLHTEVEFAVPILNPETGKETGVFHVGRMDAVVRDLYGRVWIMDHKTCSQFPNETVLRLDEQMGYYLLAAHYLFPDYRIAGVLYNAIKKTDPARTRSDQFRRYKIIRNGYEIQSIRTRLYRAVMEMLNDQYHEPHPGHHCSWRCPYVNLCIAEEDGSDVELLKDTFDRQERKRILATVGGVE